MAPCNLQTQPCLEKTLCKQPSGSGDETTLDGGGTLNAVTSVLGRRGKESRHTDTTGAARDAQGRDCDHRPRGSWSQELEGAGSVPLELRRESPADTLAPQSVAHCGRECNLSRRGPPFCSPCPQRPPSWRCQAYACKTRSDLGLLRVLRGQLGMSGPETSRSPREVGLESRSSRLARALLTPPPRAHRLGLQEARGQGMRACGLGFHCAQRPHTCWTSRDTAFVKSHRCVCVSSW